MARHESPAPPEIYADEPVLFRKGPHWVSQDLTLGLAGLTFGWLALAALVDWNLWRYALLPAAPLLVRLAVDLPRYWRFETVLTTRRLIVNVGTVRDVYHTLQLRHITSIEAQQNLLGKLMGFGTVVVELEGKSPDGAVHRGTYVLDYVRHPMELAAAIDDAMTRI